jgi:hypothetical protein
LNSAALIFFEQGTRTNKLITCLRARVDPSELRILGPRHHVLVVADLRGRTDHALHQLLSEILAACDPHWQDLAVFSKGSGSRATIGGGSR